LTVRRGYAGSVFINCPFDSDYQPLFHAIVFAILDAGFTPRSALELDDGLEVRIDKILNIISDCKFSLHDLSRTELQKANRLPRFNMPFELGICVGAKRFGDGVHKEKSALILDVERYRYQAFISDIAGQDIKAHNGDPQNAITHVRNWLSASSRRRTIPGGAVIWGRYNLFREALPRICDDLLLDPMHLTYGDYVYVAGAWLKQTT
jgi:hypothetical protein